MKMEKIDLNKFKVILQNAIGGNCNDMDKLLQMYNPLIKRYSYIHGKIDKDLRQYLFVHIIKNLSKFII